LQKTTLNSKWSKNQKQDYLAGREEKLAFAREFDQQLCAVSQSADHEPAPISAKSRQPDAQTMGPKRSVQEVRRQVAPANAQPNATQQIVRPLTLTKWAKRPQFS
jgi:hypothetical protein